MENENKKLKKVVAPTLSEAALKTLESFVDADITVEDFLDTASPFNNKVEDKLPLDDTADPRTEADNLEVIVDHLSSYQKVPGKGLTNDPEKPYPWETPPDFANPRDAQDDMFVLLSTPDVTRSVLEALASGISVADLTGLFVFNGFMSGKFTPDVGLLIAESTAFFIMALGEKANIEYKIEEDDSDLDDMVDDKLTEKLLQMDSMKQIAKLSNKKDVKESDIPSEIVEEVEERVEPSLLAPTQKSTEESKSLLDRK
jgi:hypothetical protein